MLKYEKIINNYKRLYGEKKFNKISKHISNSKHSKNLIHQSINKSAIPNGTDFVASIHSNLRYSFAKAETILIASLVLFELWVDSFGLTNSYPDKNTLKEIEKEIIEQAKSESFSSDFSILKNIKEPQKGSSNLKNKPFPYFGESFITDVMREIDFETGKEHTGKLITGLFEFTENFIRNNYDDEKGNIAYDKDDLPAFKKSWDYLGFDGKNYIFSDENGVKWYINDNSIKFRDEQKKVQYKFEITKNNRTYLNEKKTSTGSEKDPFSPKNTTKPSIDKRTLKDPQNHIDFDINNSEEIIKSLRSSTLNRSSYFYDYGHLLEKNLVAHHKQKIISNDYSAGSYNSKNDRLGELTERERPIYFFLEKEQITCSYTFESLAFEMDHNNTFKTDYLGLIDEHLVFHTDDNFGERLWFINENLIRIIRIKEPDSSFVYLGDLHGSDLYNVIYYVHSIR